jgi:hypothetical protein
VTDPIEIVLHPALIEPFKEWLGRRGLLLMRLPDELQDAERLVAYIVSPTEEAMRRG